MRNAPRRPERKAAVLAALDVGYAADRARVEASYRRMRDVTAAPHTPADARQAANELTVALRQATATVTRALRIAEPTTAPSLRHPARRRRRATRAIPAGVQPWSAELVRLTDIGMWLIRTTLDDPGVHVAHTVRVGSRAANGPHIAGMVFEPDDLVAATLHEPRIGVDLQAIIDGCLPRSTATTAATAAARAIPRAT